MRSARGNDPTERTMALATTSPAEIWTNSAHRVRSHVAEIVGQRVGLKVELRASRFFDLQQKDLMCICSGLSPRKGIADTSGSLSTCGRYCIWQLRLIRSWCDMCTCLSAVVVARHLKAGHEFRIGWLHRAGPRGAVTHDAVGHIELRPFLH